MRQEIVVYSVSLLSLLIGILNLILYFYDLIPGQIPTGSPFYLRVSVVFIAGLPILIQVLNRIPPAQRPKAVSVLSLLAVLVFAIILMSLLLPSMTKTIGTWDG